MEEAYTRIIGAMKSQRRMPNIRTSAYYDIADYAAAHNISIDAALELPKGIVAEYIAYQRTKSMLEFCYANIEHLT